MSNLKIEDLLINELVMIQYIPNYKNGINDKTHPLYGGLSNKATVGISAPLHNNGISKLFTPEELQLLGTAIGEDISPRSDFWKEFRIDQNGMKIGMFPIYVGKDGLLLNKKEPEDFIKIRVLENANLIARSYDEIKERETEVRFFMINKKDIHKQEIESISFKRRANQLFGKVEDNKDVLIYLLRQFKKGVDDSQSLEFMQTEVYKEMESQPKIFVGLVEDPFILTKIKLEQYLRYNLIEKVKDLYYDLEGNKLALDGKINTLSGAAEFLDSGIGSEIKLILDSKLEQLKK